MSAERPIALDGSGWANPRGEGRYLRGLAAALAEAEPRLDWRLVVDERDHAAARSAVAGIQIDAVRLRHSPGRALAAGGTRSPADVFALGRAVRRLHPGVLVQPSLVGWFPLPGVAQVVGVHDVKPPAVAEVMFGGAARRGLYAVKERAALRSAAGLFTVSRYSRDQVAARVGLPSERISLAPPAAAGAFVPRTEREITRVRRALGIPVGAPFLVHAGGLNRHKDPATLIGALAELHRRGRSVPHAVLVGSWRGAYGSIGSELAAAAQRLGIADRLRMPGHVADEELAALYTGSLALVSCSLHEGFGMPVLEAACCGTALILSDIAAHREAARQTALFFEPGDAAGLADRIALLLDDPGSVPRPDPAEQNHSWAESAAAIARAAVAVG